MADNAIVAIDSARRRAVDSSTLGETVDFDVRGLGRRLPRTDAPAGWIKKIERRRDGKVWVGFFHLWTTDSNGRKLRQKKEKTLGPRLESADYDYEQRERTAVQLEGFRRELEQLHLSQPDKRSVTLWANYEQIIRQLEDETPRIRRLEISVLIVPSDENNRNNLGGLQCSAPTRIDTQEIHRG
jgi:hypothetical protein